MGACACVYIWAFPSALCDLSLACLPNGWNIQIFKHEWHKQSVIPNSSKRGDNTKQWDKCSHLFTFESIFILLYCIVLSRSYERTEYFMMSKHNSSKFMQLAHIELERGASPEIKTGHLLLLLFFYIIFNLEIIVVHRVNLFWYAFLDDFTYGNAFTNYFAALHIWIIKVNIFMLIISTVNFPWQIGIN